MRDERCMRELVEREWKLADIGRVFKNSFKAILKGQFLLRMNVGKYFVHIVFTFFLMPLVIWISLMIEGTMAKVEKNKKVIENLRIENAQKMYDAESLMRRSTVEANLGRMGSEGKEPEKRATVLK